MLENFPAEAIFGDDDEHRGSNEDGNDAKRRRIARVRDDPSEHADVLTSNIKGLRYVSKEENQVRCKNAEMLALRELQNRMHFHSSGEKESST